MSECCVIFKKKNRDKIIVLIYCESLTVMTPCLNLGRKADSRRDGGNRVLVIGVIGPQDRFRSHFKYNQGTKSIFANHNGVRQVFLVDR